jgi:hypothetical protein
MRLAIGTEAGGIPLSERFHREVRLRGYSFKLKLAILSAERLLAAAAPA